MEKEGNVLVGIRRTERRSARGGDDVLRATVGDICWLVLMNLLIFECVLQEMAPQLSYLDELAAIVVAVVSLAAWRRSSARTTGFGSAVACLLCLVLLGLLGNALSGVQASVYPIIIDVVTCVKFPVALIAGFSIFQDRKRLYSLLLWECKALLLIMAACAFANIVFDVGMGDEVRFGVRSFRFVFTHYTFLSMAVAGMLLLLSCDAGRNRFWIALSLALMCSTLRSKAFGFVLVFLLLLLTCGKGRRTPYGPLLLGAAAAIVLCWDQIVYYYTSDGFARNEITRASLEVARDYAPLGAGFATFGSNVTGNPEYYSPLYYAYGLSTVYGLTPTSASFVSDTFWPTVLGQFGYLGAVVYLVLLYLMFSIAKKKAPTLPVLALFAYLLISSTSESAFFNPSSVFLALCIGLAAAGCPQEKKPDRL